MQIISGRNLMTMILHPIYARVRRMKKLSIKSKKKFVVADFVCPKKKQIKIFMPDFIIWMDTIKKGRFDNMNKMFRPQKDTI